MHQDLNRQTGGLMRHLEDALQAACFEWLHLARPDVLAWAVPNGGKRDIREAARLRKQGVMAGVADITVAIPSRFLGNEIAPQLGQIELKSPKGTLSDNQQLFRDKCKQRGIPYAVCRSLTEFQGVISGWCGSTAWPAEDISAYDAEADSRANYNVALRELAKR